MGTKEKGEVMTDFIVYISKRTGLIKGAWLVKAESGMQTLTKFEELSNKEAEEGDEPLIKKNEQIFAEPVEFENDVCQIY
jgi:hypothetical protein